MFITAPPQDLLPSILNREQRYSPFGLGPIHLRTKASPHFLGGDLLDRAITINNELAQVYLGFSHALIPIRGLYEMVNGELPNCPSSIKLYQPGKKQLS